MFGTRQSGVNAYAKVGIETGVAAASPHKLIVMLYDGALTALSKGLIAMREGDIATKGKSISHAITIIDSGLRASLDKNVGGEIAISLDSLYEYMSSRLMQANLKNQPEVVVEVQGLLIDLRDTWNAIGNTPEAQGNPKAAPQRAPSLASA